MSQEQSIKLKSELNISRDFKGIWIPREIWLLNTISIESKCLWGEMNSLLDREIGGCYASDEYLAKFMGCKITKLKVLLKELRDHGLLKTISFDGRRAVRLAIDPEKTYENKQVPAIAASSSPAISSPDVSATSTPETRRPPVNSTVYIRSKEKNKDSRAFALSAEADGLSLLLLKKIKETKPDLKKPRLKKWALNIDLMIRIDKRSPQKIESIINWLPSNEFWRKNILSGEKLRKQFDKLELEMDSSAGQSIIRQNRQLVMETKNAYTQELHDWNLSAEYVYNNKLGKELSLKMNPTAFEAAFAKLIGGEVDVD